MSRSPRGRRHVQEKGIVEESEEQLPEWNGTGPNPLERSFMGQLSQQRAFLEKFLEPKHLKSEGVAGGMQRAPREMAAGLPLEAARALILLGPEQDGPLWMGTSSELACLAAALRLFARLMPGGRVEEEACERFCKSVVAEGPSTSEAQPRAVQALAEGAEERVSAWDLTARRVSSATASLKAMVRNRPAACLVLLENYVGVLEHPDTGEEVEQEVGVHCLLVVGGDLLGPTYVVFDPFGLRGGDVAFWSEHELNAAAPVVCLEVSPAPA